MPSIPKEKHNRYEKTGKRSVFADKRLFRSLKILPIPGKLLIHLVAIAIYISYEILVSMGHGERYGLEVYATFYLVFIFLFYFNAHICYPTIQSYNRPLWASIILLLFHWLILIIVFIAINHSLRFYLTGELTIRTSKQTFFNALWRSINLMAYSGVYWFCLNLIEQKRREVELLKRHREAERRELILQIAYDNSRMNPHFLFNTLQYVHGEVEKVSPKAELVIAGLADMVRYSFAPLPEDGMVQLKDELAQVDRFIRFNRQLHGTRFHFEYSNSLDDAALGLKIPPHMVLAIAENMVKHGVMDDAAKAAYLRISCEGTTLEVEARNHKPEYAKPRGSGIGMSSLRSRLRYLYPGKHTLDIENNPSCYNLKLTILL